MEIERKFLLDLKKVKDFISLIPSNQVKKIEIEQFYTQTKPFEIRFRKSIQKNRTEFFKTIKKGSGLSREEEENNISEDSFYKNIKDSYISLVKTRYVINNRLEIDFYPDGLSLMEIEYDSEEEANRDNVNYNFIRKEVTGNKFYSNSSIAKRG